MLTREIKSFDVFGQLLQERTPDLVVVQAYRGPRNRFDALWGTTRTWAGAEISQAAHMLTYAVHERQKQRRFREHLFTSLQIEHSFIREHDADRNKRMISVLLAGVERVGQIQDLLPDTTVYLGDGRNNPMSSELLAKLRDDAEQLDVTSALKSDLAA